MAQAGFSPLASDKFSRRHAAHLLRRAGFGASKAEIDEAVAAGMEATVDRLLAGDADDQARQQKLFEDISGGLLNFSDPGQAQAWWLYRMATTRTPLLEKLSLFWHGHFATSVMKVEDMRLMLVQWESLRRHALGNLRDLVSAVARDPAMLVYLDGQTNTREHPNENFARELMELFTCGIGHYTEQDVKQAARAFTGWHRDETKFVFHAEEHDGERKEFLGRKGRFDGQDIIDILLQHPATPRFVGGKLLRFFAAGQPSDAARAAAGELFDRTRLDVKWFLRDLFLSEYFYSDECLRKRIASPAEYVVGTLRTLGAKLPALELKDQMTAMGQELFAPPNVKGWDGEQRWISSSTWPARLAFAASVAELPSEAGHGPHLPLAEIVPADLADPARVVDALAETLMQGELAAETRRSLAEHLVSTDEGPMPEQFRDDAGFREQQVRSALAMLLSLPEYHAY